MEQILRLPSASISTDILQSILAVVSMMVSASDTAKIPKKDRLRLDIVEALKKIKIPNLRWPGGCYADEYHWRDGIGPRNQRPKTVNTHWGMITEDNSFGTHEFLEFCELIGAEPYLAGNVGSGSPQEMANWVEYL